MLRSCLFVLCFAYNLPAAWIPMLNARLSIEDDLFIRLIVVALSHIWDQIAMHIKMNIQQMMCKKTIAEEAEENY